MLIVCSLVQLLYSSIIYAEDDWQQCSIPIIKKPIDKTNLPNDIYISADFLNINKQKSIQFNGNVIFEQQPNTFKSEELIYLEEKDTLLSDTPSFFTSKNSRIESNSLTFNSTLQSGEFNHISLQILDSHRFTTADKLVQEDENNQYLKNFHFTTCEPTNSAWEISSELLSLNYETGFGIAKHAKIYLFDIPIFYFPYFQFPIDDNRHSGLLMPSFSFSRSSGHTLSIPLYWNIHPQLDSTIEFKHNSLRGLQVNTENRYLTESTQGNLLISNLNDQEENNNRYFYRLTQKSKITNNINLDLTAQKVSDEDFFNDFSVASLAKTPDYLERHLTINHQSKYWNSSLLLQNHQILDATKSISARPYEQWPKISSTGQFQLFNNSSQLQIKQSYVNFKKDDSVTGERFIFNPSISTEWSNSYSFIKPKLSFSFSQYQLKQTDNSQQSLDRSIPTYSLDSGLHFERLANEESGWLQTFEPRLFFLYTPYEDQSDIPDFDSANLSETYTNLFNTNRFTGGDRIGDTKQLTLGLSSRLLKLDSGTELFRTSLGQTFYADDRLVQLSGTAVSEESTSDLFLEIASTPKKYWTISTSIIREAESDFIKQKTFKVSRNENNNHILNISYRFKGEKDDSELEQTDISMVYPINKQWTLYAKRQYSLIDHQTVEQLIGTSYDSCCWAFSVIIQESADDDFVEFDRSIYFQFSLKGLSSIGRKNQNLLSESIPGYLY